MTTVIPLDEHGAQILGKRILVPGLPRLGWQIDLDELRTRLLAEDAEATRAAFAEAVSAAPKAPRPASRRKTPPRKSKRTKSD